MNEHGTLTEVESRKIRNMGILCAFLVVIIHVRPMFATGTIGWWVREIAEEGICQIAVPFFFIVSGFFLGKELKSGTGGVFPCSPQENSDACCPLRPLEFSLLDRDPCHKNRTKGNSWAITDPVVSYIATSRVLAHWVSAAVPAVVCPGTVRSGLDFAPAVMVPEAIPNRVSGGLVHPIRGDSPVFHAESTQVGGFRPCWNLPCPGNLLFHVRSRASFRNHPCGESPNPARGVSCIRDCIVFRARDRSQAGNGKRNRQIYRNGRHPFRALRSMGDVRGREMADMACCQFVRRVSHPQICPAPHEGIHALELVRGNIRPYGDGGLRGGTWGGHRFQETAAAHGCGLLRGKIANP